MSLDLFHGQALCIEQDSVQTWARQDDAAVGWACNDVLRIMIQLTGKKPILNRHIWPRVYNIKQNHCLQCNKNPTWVRVRKPIKAPDQISTDRPSISIHNMPGPKETPSPTPVVCKKKKTYKVSVSTGHSPTSPSASRRRSGRCPWTACPLRAATSTSTWSAAAPGPAGCWRRGQS